MNDLLLNKSTLAQARAFINSPSHALLISGGGGSGKASIARLIASELLGLRIPQQLEKYPYFTHLMRPEGKQDIPIDAIRQLNKVLKLKAPGSREIRRVVVIEDAQDLNEEASNALLKIAVDQAKGYLRKDIYERLLLSDSLSRDKKQLVLLLEALSKLLAALQSSTATRGSHSQTQKILASRRLVFRLQEALEANASPKLISLKLSLNLL